MEIESFLAFCQTIAVHWNILDGEFWKQNFAVARHLFHLRHDHATKHATG